MTVITCPNCKTEQPKDWNHLYCSECLSLLRQQTAENLDNPNQIFENLRDDKYSVLLFLKKACGKENRKIYTCANVLFKEGLSELLEMGRSLQTDQYFLNIQRKTETITAHYGLMSELVEYVLHGLSYAFDLPNNFTGMVMFLKNKAADGDAQAMFDLSEYYSGSLAGNDQNASRYWLKAAYQRGHSQAIYKFACQVLDPKSVTDASEAETQKLLKQLFELAESGHTGALCLYLANLKDTAPNEFLQKVYKEFDELDALNYYHLAYYFKTRAKGLYIKCLDRGVRKDSDLFGDLYCEYLAADSANGWDNLAIFLQTELGKGKTDIPRKWLPKLLSQCRKPQQAEYVLDLIDQADLNNTEALLQVSEYCQNNSSVKEHDDRAVYYCRKAAINGSQEARERLFYNHPNTPVKFITLQGENGELVDLKIVQTGKYADKTYMVLEEDEDRYLFEYVQNDPLEETDFYMVSGQDEIKKNLLGYESWLKNLQYQEILHRLSMCRKLFGR